MAAPTPESRARAQAAAKLADEGKFRCHVCRRVLPLDDGLLVCWGGNVLLGLCPDCAMKEPVVLRPVDEGVEVKPLSGYKPADILVVGSLSRLDQFVPKKALAHYEKFSIEGDE